MRLLDFLPRRFDPEREPPAAPAQPGTQWLILQQGANPSSDYYIRPEVEAGGLPVRWRHVEFDTPQEGDLAPGTVVVIVRYLTPRWAEALRVRHRQLARVIYFMDDDLLTPAHWRGLPVKYRAKLTALCRRMYPSIQALAHEYWTSTPTLATRYPAQGMRVIAPRPLPEDIGRSLATPRAEGRVQIFYHGSGVHQAEIQWLHPVMAEVLARCPRAHFEIIGDRATHRLYRGLPRARVLYPMNWPNYLAHCRSLDGHIGLAPLLPSAFNDARSHAKAFDIARCAASGLYAASPAYTGHVPTNASLLMDPAAWVEAIVEKATA
ncbi:hypothetical protein [Niveibacterium sp. SC-1]|uniref:hypothetical protein n=1 Tax=Niveibacterium sp. SC-1 TaxID=3135646 RepID=UPI00311D7799